MLTVRRLREVLSYDRKTGVFVWLISPNGRAPTGSIAGSLNAEGYRYISIDGRRYRAGRLAWFYIHGEWPIAMIDHRDLIKDHDWIDNLRPASRSQNTANSKAPKTNTSGFKGVSRNRKKWRATIRENGRCVHIGNYNSPEAAHAAYIAKSTVLFGEFARA